MGDDGAVALPDEVMRDVGVGPGWSVRLVLDDGGVTITREHANGRSPSRGRDWMAGAGRDTDQG